MAELEDAQSEAAQVAARTRQAIAKKIAKFVPKVEDDTEAQVVLHLAEAYAHLAIEPPRTRAQYPAPGSAFPLLGRSQLRSERRGTDSGFCISATAPFFTIAARVPSAVAYPTLSRPLRAPFAGNDV
jgi:hypothetical protein